MYIYLPFLVGGGFFFLTQLLKNAKKINSKKYAEKDSKDKQKPLTKLSSAAKRWSVLRAIPFSLHLLGILAW